MRKWTAWSAAALLALVVVALTAAPAGVAKNGDIRVAGTCTGSTTSKIKLSAENGRIEVEFEVDQNRTGIRWKVALRRNGSLVASTTARTHVSSTLVDPPWNNSTVLQGDVLGEVSKLKQQLDGEIVVAGSIQLVRALMENDLVDELRLMIYPAVLGDGKRLFGETSDQRPVRLVETRTVDDLAYLIYEVVPNVQRE